MAKSLYSDCYADFEETRQDTAVFTLSPNTDGFTWSSGGSVGQSTTLDGQWGSYPGTNYFFFFYFYFSLSVNRIFFIVFLFFTQMYSF